MAASFAGSRCLDERRRRRIAGNWDDEEVVPDGVCGELPPAAVIEAVERHAVPRQHLPLRRLISPRLWKHLLVAAVTLIIGVMGFWAGWEAERIGEILGPEAARLVAFGENRMLDFYGAVLVAASSQLALLIWWVRSKSQTDFSGRYHVWRWTASLGFVISAGLLLDLQNVWSRTLIRLLEIDFVHCATLCWLAPVVGCGSVLLRDLLIDMRNCRAGSWLLRVAIVSWVAALTVLFTGEFFVSVELRPVVVLAGATFGYYCLFVALLLHARYVIFISAEPPKVRPAVWKRMMQRTATGIAARLKLRRDKNRERGKSVDSPEPPSPMSPQRRENADESAEAEDAPDEPNSLSKTRKNETAQLVAEDLSSAAQTDDGTEPFELERPDGGTMRFDQPHDSPAPPSRSRRGRKRRKKSKAGGRQGA